MLLVSDFIAINGAWALLFLLRNTWFHTAGIDVLYLIPRSLQVYAIWLVTFAFFGLYRHWYSTPIFDEVVTILKTLGFGTLAYMLFVLWGRSMAVEEIPEIDPRLEGFIYFILISTLTISLRLIVRYSQRRLLVAGYGRKLSLIVGDRARVEKLADNIAHFPALGYEVVGYISPNGDAEHARLSAPIAWLGDLNELESILQTKGIREILITIDAKQHDVLLDIIGRTSGVGIKIVPDLYEIISGQARTREIYGFPLIDINPQLLRPWEEATKRTLDIIISSCILLIGSPLWLLVALGVRITSRGPIIYKQERVGRHGAPFNMYKFRSMHTDAEAGGPQWAAKNDPRVTGYGRILRKMHLDEIPQFWNVLKGDMSIVGPRPERAHFVEMLSQEIPYYHRRLRVRPGLTGLGQAMVYKYDENIADVRNKLKYDFIYIESMSFRLDMKILFRTAYNVLRGRGHT